jgi:hypothetical protein
LPGLGQIVHRRQGLEVLFTQAVSLELGISTRRLSLLEDDTTLSADMPELRS